MKKFDPYFKPREPRKPQEPSKSKPGQKRRQIYDGQLLALESGAYCFEYERGSYEEPEFYLVVKCEVPNENYEKELAEYQQKLAQYDVELAKYKTVLKEWKASKKIWDAQQKEKELAAKRKQLERLKKELGET